MKDWLNEKKLDILSKISDIIVAIITVCSLIFSIVKQQFQWSVIILLFVFLIFLIFKHRFQRRIWAGIILVSVLLLSNVLQFLPKTNQYIQSVYWPTNTPTTRHYAMITPSPETTPTFPYTNTPFMISTPTLTLYPSNTSTFIPEYTISSTSTSTPICDFKNSCISKDCQAWPTTIEQTTFDSNQCMDFSGIGMLANKEGLRIFSKPKEKEIFAGLFTQIPSDDATITIKIKVDILSTNSFEESTSIYIGFVESVEKKLTGVFLELRDYKVENFPAIIFGEYPAPTNTRQIVRSGMPLGKEITIIWEKNKLAFNLTILGLDKPIEITDIPFDNNWDGFFIGYNAPIGSAISALVTDIQIEDK